MKANLVRSSVNTLVIISNSDINCECLADNNLSARPSKMFLAAVDSDIIYVKIIHMIDKKMFVLLKVILSIFPSEV